MGRGSRLTARATLDTSRILEKERLKFLYTDSMSTERSRKLVAIMFTDIVGYSLMMGDDEDHALRLLDIHDAAVGKSIEKFEGHILKRMGDAVFAEFNSATNAVRCGIDIQQRLRTHNQGCESVDQLCIRIGIHLGDVIIRNNDLFGDGINVAARLEPLAKPGGICISNAVFQAIKTTADMDPVLVGEVELKNILERHVIYEFPPFYELANVRKNTLESANTGTKATKVKLVRTEKMPPSASGIPILFFLIFMAISGLLVGAVGIFDEKIDPYRILRSELRHPSKIVDTLATGATTEAKDVWRLFSVARKDELRVLHESGATEENSLPMQRIVRKEFNNILGGTHRLVPPSDGEKGSFAAENRLALEALFPEEISVLVAPRDRIEFFQAIFLGFSYLAWGGVLGLVLGSLAFSYLMMRPATHRYVFDDIRDVDDVLEYVVGELGFKVPIRQGKNLIFRATLPTILFWNVLKISVRLDGNSAIVSGPTLFLMRLKKTLYALTNDNLLSKTAKT